MSKSKLAKWFLRAGLAFVFVYASIEIYINPDNFLKYVPEFILGIVPLDLFLLLFGVVEIVLAVWLLSGWRGFYPAMLSVLMIAGIVAFNTDHFQVLFRNVAIAFGGLALASLEMKKERNAEKSEFGSNEVTQMKLTA